ncbi:unnamed protein product [Owenia fusiformis]|uniref:Octanoyl-[acyl-carrier-protein]:protein N-octanoyltransferase LIPT2, mitochondrial n=1 Tax=Owenia fusiformis TaxID=6347 RepID=A0A8S4NJ40_OWEFU|nr:unnamed protein product [Owenia fusiformis]
MTSQRVVQLVRLGRMQYGITLNIQNSLVQRHLETNEQSALGKSNELLQQLKLKNEHDEILDKLILVEHEPVYTIGKRTKEYTLEERQRLEALGADFYKTNRGGLITYLVPGQLVAYPILNLANYKPSIKWYMDSLTDAIINTCRQFNIEASSSSDVGVWVGNNKICAMGVHASVHASRFITMHGIALNCNTDMTWFEHIVPCGLVGKGVTSISQELNQNVTIDDAEGPFLKSFSDFFKCEIVEI